jgi:hypothetical protein
MLLDLKVHDFMFGLSFSSIQVWREVLGPNEDIAFALNFWSMRSFWTLKVFFVLATISQWIIMNLLKDYYV